MRTSHLVTIGLSAAICIGRPITVGAEKRDLLSGIVGIIANVIEGVDVELSGDASQILASLSQINEKNSGRATPPSQPSSNKTVSLPLKKHLNRTTTNFEGAATWSGKASDNYVSNELVDDVEEILDDILKRDTGYVEANLNDLYSYYTTELELGTPGQSVTLQIDTGSSDLWIWDGNIVNSNAAFSFIPQLSSTLKNVSEDFTIGYGNGSSTITGFYVQDTVEIGGVTIESQQFGVGISGNAGSGILGIGPQNIELASTKYPNLPMNLKSQKIIDRTAFSLYLNNDTSVGEGTVVFGGVDLDKAYNQQLYTVPMQNNSFVDVYIRQMYLGSVSSWNSTQLGTWVMLDCGSTFTYLPDDVTTQVANLFNATYDSSSGMYFTNEFPQSYNIIINISGAYFLISEEEFLIDSSVFYSNAPAKYALTILPSSWVGGRTIFGDNFLRNLYIVVDYDNMQVSIANAVYTDSSNIYNIPAGSGLIPGAKLSSEYNETP